MPDTDRLTAELDVFRRRGYHKRASSTVARWQSDRAAEDIPRLVAALETALEALGRHQHAITDSRGTICAGCLSDWPCPDTAAITAALTGHEQAKVQSTEGEKNNGSD